METTWSDFSHKLNVIKNKIISKNQTDKLNKQMIIYYIFLNIIISSMIVVVVEQCLSWVLISKNEFTWNRSDWVITDNQFREEEPAAIFQFYLNPFKMSPIREQQWGVIHEPKFLNMIRSNLAMFIFWEIDAFDMS